jgi:pantothenate kinase
MELPNQSLAERARRLVVPGERRMLGLTGAPAAGKSTLAAAIVEALAPDAVLVPIDGFHLAAAELRRLGRIERKGAPDTFDAAGYVALLRRLRDRADDVVYAPEFRREIEEPIAGAIAVPRDVPLVVTEGNYLLQWTAVRELLDEVWFVELDEDVRVERLIARHMAYGRSRSEAEGRAHGSDQRNAELINATRNRADLVVSGRLTADDGEADDP